MFHGASENVRRECHKERDNGDYDPEELLAHPDDATNPGEEGQGLNGQLGSGLQNLLVKVDIQTISVRLTVKANVSGFIPFGKYYIIRSSVCEASCHQVLYFH